MASEPLKFAAPPRPVGPGEPTVALQPLPPGAKHRFHAMVKPVGSMCNLDCTYCYYLHKEELLEQPRQPRMSDEMLERHIRQYIEAQTGDEVVFSWQGGEPTILGLEFFRKVVELQARHRKPGQRIENDLQTNGTLLDEQWASFLKQHHFLVGLSCDGPQRLHDLYRYTKGGTPTHDKVVAAARLLRKHGVPFNALCVVNRENAKFPLDVYRFLTRELGAKRVQLIACVEPKVFRDVAPQHWEPAQLPVVGTPQAKPGAPDSVVTDWSVDPEDGRIPVQGLGRLALARLRQGARGSVRDSGRAVTRPALAALRHRGVLRQGAGGGTRRRRLLVRPLRLSRVPAGKPARDALGRNGVRRSGSRHSVSPSATRCRSTAGIVST